MTTTLPMLFSRMTFAATSTVSLAIMQDDFPTLLGQYGGDGLPSRAVLLIWNGIVAAAESETHAV